MNFFVGAHTSFRGKEKSLVNDTKVRILEKLGHSSGRAKRFLNTHKPLKVIEHVPDKDGNPVGVERHYRAIVFKMPNGYRLQNDVVRAIIKDLKCDWQTAKFHAYRIAAQDVVGNQEDWPELFPKEESTAEPAVVSPTAVETNQPVTEGAAPLPV
jgi:hypothetical protein